MLQGKNLLSLIIILFSFDAQGMAQNTIQEINTAARTGNLATLTELVEKHGKQLDNKAANLALWHALDGDQFGCAKLLLTKGAQLDAIYPGKEQRTLYEYFSKTKFKLHHAKWLLEHGADPDKCSSVLCTPLHEICEAYDLKRFYKAAFKEMQLLCEHGADPNAHAVRTTCLIQVIGQGKKVTNKVGMITLLLKAGAEINAQDICGNTALHTAVIKMPEIVPCLLNRGARKDIKDSQGNKAIDLVENNPELYVMLASDALPPIPKEAIEAERELNKLKIKLA
jgi:hypothetical protein